jgi:hypothetical protein
MGWAEELKRLKRHEEPLREKEFEGEAKPILSKDEYESQPKARRDIQEENITELDKRRWELIERNKELQKS